MVDRVAVAVPVLIVVDGVAEHPVSLLVADTTKSTYVGVAGMLFNTMPDDVTLCCPIPVTVIELGSDGKREPMHSKLLTFQKRNVKWNSLVVKVPVFLTPSQV